MRMIRSLSLLLFVTVAALAQPAPPPVIRSINPQSGPPTGGTLVEISGSNLGVPPNFACLLPCPTVVTFGGVPARLERESEKTLIVRTPAHAPGSVDVAITTGDGRSTVSRAAFLYTTDPEATFERMLLPIYLETRGGGSNGSQWETRFWLRNNGVQPMRIAPWVCNLDPCIPLTPESYTLPAGETLQFLSPGPGLSPGRMLYVDRDSAAGLSLNLRLLELSQSQTDAGTEIPIVRENEFRTTALHLHGVPLNGRFRVAVRIYEMDTTGSRFRLRIYEEGKPGNPLPLTEVEMTATSSEKGPFRWHPAYAEYGALTDLLRLPMPQPPTVRIDIEPLTSGSRYWAFVSITNNETQRVTLITPQ